MAMITTTTAADIFGLAFANVQTCFTLFIVFSYFYSIVPQFLPLLQLTLLGINKIAAFFIVSFIIVAFSSLSTDMQSSSCICI